MAEEKETKPKKASDQKNKNDDFSWSEILKAFLPLIGIFGAFCYVLGRSYIESYYSSLGMTTDALTFSPNDYMFFSTTVVILCLFISLLFFLYWEFSESGRGLFSNAFLKKRKIKFFNNNIRYFTIAMGFMAILLFGSLIYLILSFVIEGLKNPWSIVGCSFLILFSFLILCADLMHYRQKRKRKGPLKVPPAIRVILAIFIGIVVFLITLSSIDMLAEAQAKNDEMTFPDVRVITHAPLPVHIKSGMPECTNYLDGQLIITNNDIAYILKWFFISKDSDCRDIVIRTANFTAGVSESDVGTVFGDYKKCRLIYAIPVEGIEDIIYYSEM